MYGFLFNRLSRTTFCIAAAVLVLLQLPSFAAAESRIALIVGNQEYETVEPLVNPHADATRIADALQRLGFDTRVSLDLGLADTARTVRQFEEDLPAYDVALFYYSGHALQIDDSNYVIPVDYDGSDPGDLKKQSMALGQILKRMQAHVRTSILFLDACRDNPFSAGGASFSASNGQATRGLSAANLQLDQNRQQGVRWGAGAMIAFSTAPGMVAFDGRGENSPFTEALLASIDEPGLDLVSLITRVRAQVVENTGGRQIPWERNSLTEPFFFVSGSSSLSVASLDITGLPDGGQVCFWINEWQCDPSLQLQVGRQYPVYASAPGFQPWQGTLALSNTNRSLALSMQSLDIATKVDQWLSNMRKVEGGEFRIGAAKQEAYREKDETLTRVKVGSFLIDAFETTFDQYDLFAEITGREKPDDDGWGRGNRPVINVSWQDAVAYTEWLSELSGRSIRLPTEAEWEVAARAGIDAAYQTGSGIAIDQANFNPVGLDDDAEYLESTLPVGSFQANASGLFDVHGNVWEWTCSDYESSYAGMHLQCSTSSNRVVKRGGSWRDDFRRLRFANRSKSSRSARNTIGFRIVQDL